MDIFCLAKPFIHALDAETAHHAAIKALRYNLVPSQKPIEDARLSQSLWGIDFNNPVGMAAGFDKNAECIPALAKQGFGSVEVGTLTPKPQAGNSKPRLFRLSEDQAIINRMGFNNAGVEDALPRLAAKRDCVLGINIGKNKTTENALDDYIPMLEKVLPHADYVTVNISSPNTEGLRDLQAKEQLTELLSALVQTRGEDTTPLLLKIAPDLSPEQASDAVQVVMEQRFDGIIVSNTTIARPDYLQSHQRLETGGLSGAPLMQASTELLRHVAKVSEGNIPLIGVGGIACGADAYAKIKAGASLVQVYSALIYQGFGLVNRINSQLLALLERDGFSHISEAIGVEA